MSQAIFSTIIASSTSGNQLATILNGFKDAVVSGFSGTSRPSQLQAGGYWVDITSDPTWILKLYDGTNDIVLFTLNTTNGTASISGASSIFEILKTSDDVVSPILKLLKERIAGNGQVLNGDGLGEVRFYGTQDDGIEVVQAKIRAASRDNVTALAQGSIIVFEAVVQGSAALVEMMRLQDSKLGIGTNNPVETLHVRGTAAKIEKASDDTVGAKLSLQKKRIAGSGGVTSGDSLGVISFESFSSTSADILGAEIRASATENHTTANQGTRIEFFTKNNTTNTLASKMIIDTLGVTIPVLAPGTLVSGMALALRYIDTEANLATYAATATNGQWVFASDTKTMYQIIDNELIPSGSGGGGGSLIWNRSGDTSPISEYVDGFNFDSFDNESTQEIFTIIAVPSSYRAGKPIKLKGGNFFCNTTTGKVFFKAQTALIRSTSVLGTYPNIHASTNTVVTVNATANTINSIGDIDLTSSTGQINGVAVAPGDKLRVRLYRDNSAESGGAGSAAADARLLTNAFELTLS